MRQSKTQKRLTGGIVTVVALAVCLVITTFALVYTSVSVQNNLFGTGNVSINLNNGKPVISENEFLFEPGMTVQKNFFVENTSSGDVYYKLYFENVSGGLSTVLRVTLQSGQTVLYSGTAAELSQENAAVANDVLKIGQRRQTICAKPNTAIFRFALFTGHGAAQSAYNPLPTLLKCNF